MRARSASLAERPIRCLLRGAAFFFMIAAQGAVRVRSALRIYPRFERVPHCLVGLTNKETAMWYFTWILGVGVALAFGVINVMWLETNGKFARDPHSPDTPPVRAGGRPL